MFERILIRRGGRIARFTRDPVLAMLQNKAFTQSIRLPFLFTKEP